MELHLIRQQHDNVCTLGELFVDGQAQCVTLELPVIDGKHGSAIAPGRYQLALTPSPRFQRKLPLVMNVPDRTDIRIHAGNWATDTEGCILVGLHEGHDEIEQSQAALAALLDRLDRFWSSPSGIWLTVE